jgi:chemotaxis protein MotB
MADEDIHECPECPPVVECVEGSPAWMATFADLVTLLLTFFVLLYAMSKTEISKFNSVAGSIRKAFAGNAMQIGETIQLGKSPDDSPTMIESQQPVEPYPIDLLTTEGILDKHEMNRESAEDLEEMKEVLGQYDLQDSVDVYQMNEGIKIRVKDIITFKEGSTAMTDSSIIPVLKKVINLMKDNNWTLFVEGYASRGEVSKTGQNSWDLSSKRASEVTRALIQRGVRAEKITTMFYGDSRAQENQINRRVEFILRKIDFRTEGKKAKSR